MRSRRHPRRLCARARPWQPPRLPWPSCPVGGAVQTITVINQAKVRPWALAKVKNAIVAQSLQLRAAWGTPCVQFGPGGWPLYLKGNGTYPWGVHYGDPTHAYVYTAGVKTAVGWTVSFSHEVMETLVDPTTAVDYEYNGETALLEVADPVELHAYRLGGVWVSDFLLPSYFAGSTLGVCTPELAGGQECTVATVGDPDVPVDGLATSAPLIAPADSSGPYDQMHMLSAPWSGGDDDGS